jgi:Phage DNA packaging protein Nu1
MPRFGSGADLARELGISRVAVHKAEKSGRISRTADGKFDLEAAAIQYRLHTNPEQSRRALAQQGQGATAALATPLGSEDWRTRQLRAETERSEIELARLKGTVATTAGIESASARAGYAIVGALVPLPDRIASECGETDAQRRKIRQVAEREIDRVRAEIADALQHGPQ